MPDSKWNITQWVMIIKNTQKNPNKQKTPWNLSRVVTEGEKVVPWHWRVLPDSEFSMPDDGMGSKSINVRSCHLAAGLFSIEFSGLYVCCARIIHWNSSLKNNYNCNTIVTGIFLISHWVHQVSRLELCSKT